MATIARYNKELRLLSLAGCVRIGDQDMISLSQSRGVANLTHIDLCGCEDLSPEGGGRFLRAAENLRCVNLNMIPAITEDAIGAMQVIMTPNLGCTFHLSLSPSLCVCVCSVMWTTKL